jgi:BirA family biotin operon repressor/biotin-[acetyl-CoA-carboxylase] ligase
LSSNPAELPPDFGDALAGVAARLGRLGRGVHFFTSTASTNDTAMALAANGGGEGIVVVADAQTAGRGRRGRAWFSPSGTGLYVSVVLTPGRARVGPDRATALLTLAAGVAIAEAVERLSGFSADIKWPNDLLIGRRKVAGILAEGGRGDAIILGYGINVRPTAYPPELSGRATSLESELGRTLDRARLFAESLAALASRYEDLLNGRFDAILDEWRLRAPSSAGSRVAWDAPAGRREGVTAGIDERGALLVQTSDRVERIVAGELTWL